MRDLWGTDSPRSSGYIVKRTDRPEVHNAIAEARYSARRKATELLRMLTNGVLCQRGDVQTAWPRRSSHEQTSTRLVMCRSTSAVSQRGPLMEVEKSTLDDRPIRTEGALRSGSLQSRAPTVLGQSNKGTRVVPDS